MTLPSHVAEFILLLVAADNHALHNNSIIFFLRIAADFFTRWQINLYAVGRDRRFCLILLLYFSAADHRRQTPNFVSRADERQLAATKRM